MSTNNKNMPSAPPPYVEHPQGQHAPYGFTANVGQPQPSAGVHGYSPYQPGYPPAQPGYPPGQPGYPPGPQSYHPTQPGYPGVQTVQSVTSPGQPQTVTMQPQGQTVIVNVGGCPNCRVGVLEDSYTCCGVCCAIVFFPVGILCCLAMKEKRCVNCNSTF